MKKIGISFLAVTALVGAGCQQTTGGGSSAAIAQQSAQQQMYQPVGYANQNIRGVAVLVLPGDVRSNHASFTQRFGPNNIADYAELELGRANFPVLERRELGPVMREVEIAYNLGDPNAARRLFQLGKFRTTKYVLKFDVLRAEPVAQASQGFDGRAMGSLLGTAIGGRAGYAAGTVAGSAQSSDDAQVWIVGLRYRIIDASTTEQVATGYFEQTMQQGSQGTSFMGVSQASAGGQTLDQLVQRLVQQSVQEIDARYKGN
ncbi:hypothetical protein EDC65_4334 [Stella humosa]|uniref:Lipoprotein n=1 Tax=Stella humosa TaxID=94 RepID=A0A3N1L2P8_9PROT|nr:hypothetical protein [Stella humosa]ROP83685.1 hypothetical protein EDC65_4334 [Stella humosa]BBK33043.1 hypothetical protein STHU_36770 [Stella humosa]